MLKVRFIGDPESHKYKVSSNPDVFKQGGEEHDVDDAVAAKWQEMGYCVILPGQPGAPESTPQPAATTVEPPPGVTLDQTEKANDGTATTETE